MKALGIYIFSLLETLLAKVEREKTGTKREPAQTIRPRKGLTRPPLRRRKKQKRKMVKQADGESKQEAEVEL